MCHDRDEDITDQLRDLGLISAEDADPTGPAEELTAPKPARKQRPKPSPAKAAKKAKASKDEQPISITSVAETIAQPAAEPAPAAETSLKKKPAPAETSLKKKPSSEIVPGPLRDLILLKLSDVCHCGIIGKLVMTARLQEGGSRLIRMRFDFTHERTARWEIRLLPVGERGGGWVSSFHDGKSAMAVHVFRLNAEKR